MTDAEIENLITAHMDTAFEIVTGELWGEMQTAQNQLTEALERISVLEQTILKYINA